MEPCRFPSVSPGPFEQARTQMVETQLKRRGIQDPQVLAAMGTLPREVFMGTEDPHRAYQDNAIPIHCDQTISQPYMVALMTEALQLRPTDKVLEIGTGSGYQTAILAWCADTLYTVERHQALSDHAHHVLEQVLPPQWMNRIRFHVGDGTQGWAKYGPYDAIMVTAGSPAEIPAPLLEQLSPNHGRLIIPLEDAPPSQGQTLYRIVKTGTDIHQETLGGVRFVPLIGKHGWSEERE